MIAVICLGFVFFAAGWRLAGALADKSVRAYSLAILCCMGLALPAFLYAVYYLHILDGAAWFFVLRAARGSELLATLAGLIFGLLAALLGRLPFVGASTLLKVVIGPMAATSLAAILVVPYLKPYIVPLTTPLANHWKEDVCIQTTPSTCGPSSAATLIHFLAKMPPNVSLR